MNIYITVPEGNEEFGQRVARAIERRARLGR